jgi:hypothetical protein
MLALNAYNVARIQYLNRVGVNCCCRVSMKQSYLNNVGRWIYHVIRTKRGCANSDNSKSSSAKSKLVCLVCLFVALA